MSDPNDTHPTTPFEVVRGALEAAGYPLRGRGPLNGTRGVSDKWSGRCPRCGGSNGKLAVFVHDDGHVYPYCRAGCTPGQVLDAVGLRRLDCWPPGLREQWGEEAFARMWEPILAAVGREEKPWPELAPEALYGLAGDFVRTVEPHTEADSVALLVQFLTLFGATLGPRPHLILGGPRHQLNEYVALVGATSKGRKGTSWAPVEAVFRAAFDRFGECVIHGGLSSGEGLIWEVRDPVEQTVKGKDGSLRVEVIDPGVQDKRRLVLLHELAQTLRAQTREGSTLSAIERMAWDGVPLRTVTKNGAGRRAGGDKATGAHISLVGHITEAELRRSLTDTDAANAFANRFVWVLVRQSKKLPRGGGAIDFGRIPKQLRDVVLFVGDVDEVGMGEDAWAIWDDVYGPLSEGKPGLFGG